MFIRRVVNDKKLSKWPLVQHSGTMHRTENCDENQLIFLFFYVNSSVIGITTFLC